MMKRFLPILIMVALFLIGCEQVDQPADQPAQTEPTTTVAVEPSPIPSETSTKETGSIGGEADMSERTPVPLERGEFEVTPMAEVPEHLTALLEQITADLSGRLDVAQEDIHFLRGDAVDWPDSSLGCPEPDMMYTQVITPGYQIIVEADGQLHFYHTNGTEGFKYCPDATPVGESGAGE